MGLPRGPLTIGTWMLREIATSAGGGSPHAAMVRADLAFIGAPEVADMGAVDDDDPRWDAPRAAFDRILTDRSPEATARILDHVLGVGSMDGSDYRSVMVDPVIAHVAETLGNSVAGLVMMTRSHEDMAIQPPGACGNGDPTIAIDLVDVEYEGGILPFLTVAFEIADGVQLEAGRLEILDRVPDTIGAALPGRRLREFIAHPLLDRFDVRIRSFDGISLDLDYDGMAASAWSGSGRPMADSVFTSS